MASPELDVATMTRDAGIDAHKTDRSYSVKKEFRIDRDCSLRMFPVTHPVDATGYEIVCKEIEVKATASALRGSGFSARGGTVRLTGQFTASQRLYAVG